MRIREVICEIKEGKEIDWSKDFIKEAIFDSFEIMLLVEQFEQKFECNIKGTEIIPSNFSSLEAMESMIIRNGGKI